MCQSQKGRSLLGTSLCICKLSSRKEVQPRKFDGCWDRPGRFYLAARPQSRILETLGVEISTDKLASLTEAEILNFVRSRRIPLCLVDVSTLTCGARRYVEKPSVATRRCRACETAPAPDPHVKGFLSIHFHSLHHSTLQQWTNELRNEIVDYLSTHRTNYSTIYLPSCCPFLALPRFCLALPYLISLTHPLTYPPTCLPACVPTCLPTFPTSYFPTFLPRHLMTLVSLNLTTLLPYYRPILLTDWLTDWLNDCPTYPPNYWPSERAKLLDFLYHGIFFQTFFHDEKLI